MILAFILGGCDTLLGTFGPSDAIEAGQTNVIVVMLDTVRADHLGTYGYELPTSPHLDARAERSVVFENHIANCSWTRPSMGSMFTGLYPRTLGLFEERYDKLPDAFTLLSEHFAANGYLTLGVTSNPNMNEVFGFHQGFDAYAESGVAFSWMRDETKAGKDTFARDTPLEDATTITDRALAMVDAHEEQLGDAPYYLQVVYIDPHWPYTQPEAHELAVKESRNAGYDGGIHFVDAELERLLEGLKERGHLDDTLVVISGDHGEGLWSHPGVPNAAWHGNTLYDSVLHVPLIIEHPSLQPKRVSGLTEGIDLVPTVLDLMGWPVPDELPGDSLAAVLTSDDEPPADKIVFSETDFRQNRKHSARTATHKLIRNDDVQLFAKGGHEGKELGGATLKQLRDGQPEEFYVLGDAPEMPRDSKLDLPEAAALRAAMEAWEKAYPRRAPLQRDPNDVITGPDGVTVPDGDHDAVKLDEDTRGALKALGYLDDEG